MLAGHDLPPCGGKAAIRDAVVKIQATQIVDTLREEIKDLHGTDRVLTATVAALRRMQSHPLTQHFRSTNMNVGGEWLPNSPAVTGFAAEMLGTDDSLAAQWLIRVFLALWLWPLKDPDTELAMLRRFSPPRSPRPSDQSQRLASRGANCGDRLPILGPWSTLKIAGPP